MIAKNFTLPQLVLALLLGLAAAPCFALTLEGGTKTETTVQETKPPAAPKTMTRPIPPDDENLQPYVTDNGRGFDRCRYWREHPDADTVRYGPPDHFVPGQPIGSTQAYNGQSAPYVRCAMDPCHPGGTMCWRNHAPHNPTLSQEIDRQIRERGCTEDPDGRLHCPDPRIRQGMEPGTTPGGYDACQNPVPPPYCKNFDPQTAVKNNCRRTATGIACDTTGSNRGGHAKKGDLLNYETRNTRQIQRAPAPFGRVDPDNPTQRQPQNDRQPDDLPAGRMSNGELLPRQQPPTYRQPDDLPVGQMSNGEILQRGGNAGSGNPSYRRPDDLPAGQVSNGEILQLPNHNSPPGSYIDNHADKPPGGYIQDDGNGPPGTYIQDDGSGPPGSYLNRQE